MICLKKTAEHHLSLYEYIDRHRSKPISGRVTDFSGYLLDDDDAACVYDENLDNIQKSQISLIISQFSSDILTLRTVRYSDVGDFSTANLHLSLLCHCAFVGNLLKKIE